MSRAPHLALPAFNMSQRPAPQAILHVVDSLELGGLERVVTDLAITQHQRGHRVAVFSINATTGLAGELTRAGVDVIVGNKQGTLDMKVLRLIRHTARSMHATVVHAHNFVPNYYAALALMGMRQRPTQVVTCHDMGTRLSNKRLRVLFNWSLKRTARVAMVGKQVHDRYTQSGMVSRERAQTVLNGIPVERFTGSPARRQEARRRLGLDETAVVLGCVGRLVALKNHQLLIGLLPDLLRKQPDLHLVIVGYGDLHETLLAQARQLGVADHLTITGQRNDVADLLPGFDVFALPSTTEGVSIALLEACATGLPAVASRVGGNPEIIHDDETGLLVPVSDASATLAALERLVCDVDLRQRLGQAAQHWVGAHASTTALEQAYDLCYRAAHQAR
ncbi:MAG: hypothetical protein RI907_1424 [Pseudomonadota bacterium]|jgi:glycosyltransferase involved in cell wall biosynthesis